VLWRDKLPEKGLYFWSTERSEDEPTNIDQNTAPLGRIEALPIEDQYHILWYGERPDPDTGLTYHVYHRSYSLATATFSHTTSVLPGIYPVGSIKDNGELLMASWTVGEAKPAIAVRLLNPKTETFGPRLDIASDLDITPLLKVFHTQDRWFVLWHEQNKSGANKPFSLHLAYSGENAQAWKQHTFEQLEGYDIGTAEIKTTEAGTIYIAIDAIDRTIQDGSRHSIWLLSSEDAGNTWKVQDLRAGEGELERFQARNPSIALGETERDLLVVWQDFREVRPRLYGAYSNDHGNSWTIPGIALPGMPEGNLGLRFDVSALYRQGASYYLMGERYEDSFREKNLFQAAFTIKELQARAEEDEASEEKNTDSVRENLEARVKEFWESMEEGDYANAYEFYDPFFRSLNSKERYVGLTGKIDYSGFSLRNIDINGPLATVTGSVVGDIVPFRAPTTRELIDREPREIPLHDTWLRIDGDWYREFYSESQELKYTRY
jgi:hypothetical protein